jgi:hypothetical protein
MKIPTIGKGTGKALFDTWSAIHVSFWVVIGGNSVVLVVNPWHGFAGALIGAYVWEVVELMLERRTRLVKYPETWINRWISDPLIATPAGYFLGRWLVGLAG